jgi:hypothetical protein
MRSIREKYIDQNGVVRFRYGYTYLVRKETRNLWLFGGAAASKVVLATVISIAIVTAGCSSDSKATDSAAQKISIVWENKLVRRPGDAPEDGKIYLVKDGKRHWINHSSWIGAHSSEFPGGVQTLSASELEAIQLGDSITAEQ